MKSVLVLLIVSICSLSAMAHKPRKSVDPKLLGFLMKNRSPRSGVPLSYAVPEGYWKGVHSDPENYTDASERILTTYGLNLYDGACWQIGIAVAKPSLYSSLIKPHTEMLLSGKCGNMVLRALNFTTFVFGTDEARVYKGPNPYFFRMTSDSFVNKDPLTNSDVTWMDWKPVTGENAWLSFLGPLASYNLWLKSSKKNVADYNAPEIQLAVSSLDVFLSMQSPLGAVYYAPKGTYKLDDPTEIAAENNISLYGGLRLLRALLLKLGDPENRIKDVDSLLLGIERFFKEHCYDKKDGVFYQGGFIDASGKFVPNPVFPVDVQTWGLSVIGQMTDSWNGVGTAYEIWERTKQRSGVFDDSGNLLGVGYTDSHDILTIEWTLGAINMCRILAEQYKASHPEFSESLLKDADSMRIGIEAYRVDLSSSKTAAYLYANKRYEIPFGWWANPIPSMASTSWTIMVDAQFNPFHDSGSYSQYDALSDTVYSPAKLIKAILPIQTK